MLVGPQRLLASLERFLPTYILSVTEISLRAPDLVTKTLSHPQALATLIPASFPWFLARKNRSFYHIDGRMSPHPFELGWAEAAVGAINVIINPSLRAKPVDR